MAQRLVDTYAVGDRVEILLTIDDVEVWREGRVAGHQFPAVWVATDIDRKLWFVTNGKRIRLLEAGKGPGTTEVARR